MNLLPCQNIDKSIVLAKWLKICKKKKITKNNDSTYLYEHVVFWSAVQPVMYMYFMQHTDLSQNENRLDTKLGKNISSQTSFF